MSNLEKIGQATNLSSEEVAIIKNTVAKSVSDTELSFFLMNAKETGLNPFNKEIWCYKDTKGNLLVFAGRDGFLKKAQSDPRWNGMVSSEVRENDKFEVDFPAGKVTHKVLPTDRGKILGAYAITKPKNVDAATIEWVEFDVYNKGRFVWASHPADMIKKVAEVRVLKKAYGISGLASEYEFTIKDDVAVAVETQKPVDKTQERIKGFIEKAKDKEQLKEVEDHLDEETRPIYEQKKLAL